MCENNDVNFSKFKIKEIVASLKMPLNDDKIDIVGSFTDDEKLTFRELEEYLRDGRSEISDYILEDSNDNQSYDSENNSEHELNIFGGNGPSSTIDFDGYTFLSYNAKEESNIAVHDVMDEEDDDDAHAEMEEDDYDDVGVDLSENASHHSNDSADYNPYNTDPELLNRLDQIDKKLKKLNSDYSKAMEDFVRFQENDFDLEGRLKDIDENLKKLSFDNTTLFYIDQNPVTSSDDDSQEECNVDSELNERVEDNQNFSTINYSDSCDCSESWVNVKKNYDMQMNKIEDMLKKLCETNEKDISTINEEEMRERLLKEEQSVHSQP